MRLWVERRQTERQAAAGAAAAAVAQTVGVVISGITPRPRFTLLVGADLPRSIEAAESCG